MLRNWVVLASVSCGVGFGSTLAISQNLQQSALAGLTTVPAMAASMTILSRQRKKEIDRQIAKFKFSLDELQKQEQLLQKQLQVKEHNSREIDEQVAGKQCHLEAINEELCRAESQRKWTVNSLMESNLTLQDICHQINHHSLIKKGLEFEVFDLQYQLL